MVKKQACHKKEFLERLLNQRRNMKVLLSKKTNFK